MFLVFPLTKEFSNFDSAQYLGGIFLEFLALNSEILSDVLQVSQSKNTELNVCKYGE